MNLHDSKVQGQLELGYFFQETPIIRSVYHDTYYVL